MTAVLASCGGSDPTTATPVRDGSGTARVTVPASHPHGVVEDCSTRSWAEFGGAFTNPANLVVGPLALVGAGRPTPAAVVTRHGGQKFPLLGPQGHIVTVQVPEGPRGIAAPCY